MFGVSRAIDFAVPDVPESLEIKIKREAYLAKQALQEVQVSLYFGPIAKFVQYPMVPLFLVSE